MHAIAPHSVIPLICMNLTVGKHCLRFAATVVWPPAHIHTHTQSRLYIVIKRIYGRGQLLITAVRVRENDDSVQFPYVGGGFFESCVTRGKSRARRVARRDIFTKARDTHARSDYALSILNRIH